MVYVNKSRKSKDRWPIQYIYIYLVPADRHFWLLLYSSQKIKDKMTYKAHYRKQRIEQLNHLPKNK